MSKFRNELKAKDWAEERGQLVGFCVFDGFYYTGTREQLGKIGCLYIG